MIERKRSFGSDLAKVDSHVVTPEDYDEAPEWTDEQWEQADLHLGGKLVRRGRPKSDKPKQQITLRLDQEVIAALRASGAGWQTRVNAILAKEIAKTRPKPPARRAPARRAAKRAAKR
jgi:uncharacterized protein (DUF4415 family)